MFLLLTVLSVVASIVLEDYTVTPGRTGIEELTGINSNCKGSITDPKIKELTRPIQLQKGVPNLNQLLNISGNSTNDNFGWRFS